MALLVPLGHGGDGLAHGGGLQQGDGAAAEAAAGHAGAVDALDGRRQRDLQKLADIWVTPMTFRCFPQCVAYYSTGKSLLVCQF